MEDEFRDSDELDEEDTQGDLLDDKENLDDEDEDPLSRGFHEDDDSEPDTDF